MALLGCRTGSCSINRVPQLLDHGPGVCRSENGAARHNGIGARCRRFLDGVWRQAAIHLAGGGGGCKLCMLLNPAHTPRAARQREPGGRASCSTALCADPGLAQMLTPPPLCCSPCGAAAAASLRTSMYRSGKRERRKRTCGRPGVGDIGFDLWTPVRIAHRGSCGAALLPPLPLHYALLLTLWPSQHRLTLPVPAGSWYATQLSCSTANRFTNWEQQQAPPCPSWPA